MEPVEIFQRLLEAKPFTQKGEGGVRVSGARVLGTVLHVLMEVPGDRVYAYSFQRTGNDAVVGTIEKSRGDIPMTQDEVASRLEWLWEISRS